MVLGFELVEDVCVWVEDVDWGVDLGSEVRVVFEEEIGDGGLLDLLLVFYIDLESVGREEYFKCIC